MLNSIALRVVEEQRGKHREFVFTYRGNPTKSIYSWGWKLARERARLGQVRVHDLRHTFASHLVMSGVNLRAVQELLGHRDIKMTMRYAHLSRQHLEEAVGLLGLSLTGEMQKQMRAAPEKMPEGV